MPQKRDIVLFCNGQNDLLWTEPSLAIRENKKTIKLCIAGMN